MQALNYHQEYYQKNKWKWETPEVKERGRIRSKKNHWKNRDVILPKLREYHWKHRESQNQKMRERKLRIKVEVINHYSNGKNNCKCCGENRIVFLTLDHINGGGIKHKKEINIKGGTAFYEWIIKNIFPEGFQILCYNCNCGRDKNGGICPHEEI